MKAGPQRHQEFAGHRAGNTGHAQETSPVFAEPIMPGQVMGLLIAGGSGMAPSSPRVSPRVSPVQVPPGQCQGSLAIAYHCSRHSPVPFLLQKGKISLG